MSTTNDGRSHNHRTADVSDKTQDRTGGGQAGHNVGQLAADCDNSGNVHTRHTTTYIVIVLVVCCRVYTIGD